MGIGGIGREVLAYGLDEFRYLRIYPEPQTLRGQDDKSPVTGTEIPFFFFQFPPISPSWPETLYVAQAALKLIKMHLPCLPRAETELRGQLRANNKGFA